MSGFKKHRAIGRCERAQEADNVSVSSNSCDGGISPVIRVRESFFQRVLEERYRGKHLYLTTGITDVSTNKMHIEIKNAHRWVEALRQLLAYDIAAPREDLRLCLFNYHELSNDDINAVRSTLSNSKVGVYKLDEKGEEEWVCGGRTTDEAKCGAQARP